MKLTPRNHGSLPRKHLSVLYLARVLPRLETVPRSISCTPNQSQYGLLHRFCRSNVDLFHLVFTVFELPDELILSILSHISPDPWLPGHSTWFRIPYSMTADDSYNQRVEFLRPLSMTCWAMRLRLLPWVWEHLVFPQWNSEQAFTVRTNKIVNASHADKFLATSVKYFYALLYLWVWIDLCPLKVHDDVSHVEYVHSPFVRQMPRVLPKSPHTIYRIRGRLFYDPAHERT